MKRVLLSFACLLLAASAVRAGEAPQALHWFGGDPNVLIAPAADFDPAARAAQAAEGGLSWMVVSNSVRAWVLAGPDAAPALEKLKTNELTPILGLRSQDPSPISEDIISIGVDQSLPLPGSEAQDIIDWTNGLGGAAILANPGTKLGRYAGILNGFAAFEAFSDGKWSPECEVGRTWDKLLAKGRRLCIVGGSNEGSRPVLGRGAVATYVLAAGNTERDIVEGMRAGRTFVAERDNIHLEFTVNGAPPGAVATPAGNTVEISVRVTGREPVDEVNIIGNTASHVGGAYREDTVVFQSIRLDAKEAEQTFTLRLGRDTRYLRAVAVVKKGNCRTMTNPVFIGAGAPGPMPPDVRRKNFELVKTALDSLDWGDEPRARAVVTALLRDRELGPCAAVFIGQNFGKEELGRVRPLLDAEEPRVRALAAYVLLQVDGEAAMPEVLQLLDDPAGPPRVFAARMLVKFAKPERLASALKAARDTRSPVARYGLIALGRMPCRESLSQLRQAMYARLETTRETAETQLGLMLGLAEDEGPRFFKAFRMGDVTDELLDVAVTRAELRPLVREAANEKLAEAEQEKLARIKRDKEERTARVLTAVPAVELITVDGLADEKTWEKAAAAGDFALADGEPAIHQTTVKAAYFSDALLLLIECAEPNTDRLVMNEEARDGNVWMDDSVDIYLCTQGTRRDKLLRYYRLSVNARGVRFDEKQMRRHWNTMWTAGAKVGENGWTAEIALPFSSFQIDGPVEDGAQWLINIVRHRRVKPEEESFFTPGDPRDPSEYADLLFK